MKKTILLLGVLVSGIATAQLYSPNGAPSTLNPSSGYVGIGTTNPLSELNVVGSIYANREDSFMGVDAGNLLRLGFVKKAGFNPMIATSSDIPFVFATWNTTNIKDNITTGTPTELVRIENNGNVGIGTTNPTRKLTVAGDIYGSTVLSFQDDSRYTITPAVVPSITAPFSMPIYGLSTPLTNTSAEAWLSGLDGIRLFTGNTPHYNFIGGNLGIGTQDFTCSDCSDYRLFVKEGIRTEKVKVDIAANNGWADYVFAKDYKLMPLNDLQSYIKDKGHLPEVPTTEEAIANGIELKEMNILLLKKIEELTLYTLQQQQNMDSQNKRIEMLEKKLSK